jgi:hypothetical protein
MAPDHDVSARAAEQRGDRMAGFDLKATSTFNLRAD